jgi:Zn/Cd-binding protein ZinT
MENQNWKIEFIWIKAHAGHHGNKLADQTAKEAAINSDINECYTRMPKSTVRRELRDYSATMWQSEWDITTKGAITKTFFPKHSRQVKTKNQRDSKFYNDGNRTLQY